MTPTTGRPAGRYPDAGRPAGRYPESETPSSLPPPSPTKKRAKGSAKARQKYLKARYGKNWRQNFYGPVMGYRKGAVGTVQKLRERLQEGDHPKAAAKFDRLNPIATDIRAKRRALDARLAKKKGVKAKVTPSAER